MDPAVLRRTGPATLVPAAASTRAPSWLSGRAVRVRVLAASAPATYLLPSEGSGSDVLALVGPDALRLPGAVLVPATGGLASLRLRAGDTVTVAHGRVHAPGAVLEVRRSWRPRRLARGSWAGAAATLVALGAASLTPGRDDLPRLAADALADPAAVTSLVGLGPGLTPSGDDVLCGMLLVLGATSGPAPLRSLHRSLADAVLRSLDRTSALSATLLRAALDGYAVPPVLNLLASAQHAQHAPRGCSAEHRSAADLPALVRAVTAVGHSSGSDLLVGVRAALDLVPAHPARPHTRPREA